MVRWIKAVLKLSLSSKLLANAVLGLGLETKISVYILWLVSRFSLLETKNLCLSFSFCKAGSGKTAFTSVFGCLQKCLLVVKCLETLSRCPCLFCMSHFSFLISDYHPAVDSFFFFLSPDVNPSLEKCFLRLLSFNFIHVIERCSIFFPESLFLLCCCLVVCFT